jgi:hypothetical protein
MHQAVQMGSPDHRIAERRDGIGTLIVCEQQKDVGRSGNDLRWQETQQKKNQQTTKAAGKHGFKGWEVLWQRNQLRAVPRGGHR